MRGVHLTSEPVARLLRSTSSGLGVARRTTHPALLLSAVLLPSVLLARTLARPEWWSGGPQVWAAVAAAAVATWMGLRWLSAVTRRPRALTRRSRERILAARDRQQEQERAARSLLDGLRAGREPDELWSSFSSTSGLHVPPQIKPLIGAAMEPGALVSYLSRGRDHDVDERPWWLVLSVPLLTCIVPAAVLVLAV